MLTDVHIILTYQCTFECDHCFLFSGPSSQGTMTLPQIQRILDESVKIGSVEWVYFEGGEPFLFYPLLLEGIKRARDMGFRVGIVTNGYWAISEEDAELWLKPIQERGLDYLSISDDSFHYKEENNSARRALTAAKRLGMKTTPICIKKPFIEELPGEGQEKGASVIGGGVMFKGRAVEKLTAGLPRKRWQDLAQCPYEELRTPMRVHIDPYGHIHICQGISLGNMFTTPFSELINEYNVDSHPICASLSEGGPASLARQYDVKHEECYIDECHFCYLIRRTLTNRFPEYLAPWQVYGFGEDE